MPVSLHKTPLALFGTACLLAACAPADPVLIGVEVLSNQPHLLSGGDALIEIRSSVDNASALTLTLNGAPVQVALSAVGTEDGMVQYRALLSGLEEGENTLQVSAGRATAQLGMVNYPRTGPIISGAHQTPYFCLAQLSPEADGSKRRFAIGNGEFLDDNALDAHCSLPTRVDYVYRSSGSAEGFLPYTESGPRPADLAMTTTLSGADVPFIVRLETGTLNRAIYQIAVLHDPASGVPSAVSPSAAWNARLVYTFGGGCQPGYFQATATGGVLSADMLGKGYAVASSTLNVNSQGGCNDVVSAETAMMVKEHFI